VSIFIHLNTPLTETMVGQDDTPTVVECAPERETVIRAIKILTLKSTDNENEPLNEIGNVGELLDYYLLS
jgi:hypothetical protein